MMCIEKRAPMAGADDIAKKYVHFWPNHFEPHEPHTLKTREKPYDGNIHAVRICKEMNWFALTYS